MSSFDSSHARRTLSPRAVDPLRADSTHLNGGLNGATDVNDSGLNTEARNDCTMQEVRAEQDASRTGTSVRSATAYRDWMSVPPSARPLATAHVLVAKALDEMLHARWLNGEEGYSNTAVSRQCGVDEKQVRQWRDGEKRLPVAALMTIPAGVVIELITWIGERRGLGRQQRSVTALADAIARLERPIAGADREETIVALVDAQRRISERLSSLMKEGK